MTDTRTITSDTGSTDGAHTRHYEPKLRRVLRLNALTSAVSGVALTVAAGPIDRLLDTGHPGWIRVVGAVLLPFAAFCWWVASSPLLRLRRATALIVVGDVNWVIASIVAVVAGWYSSGGAVAVLAMAVVVDAFAVVQFVGWRRLRGAH